MFPYDLNKTGRTAATFLLIYCAAELAFMWHSFTLFGFYDLLETGNLTQFEMDAEAAQVDAFGAPVGGFLMLAMLACYIVSGMWIYRAAANAQAVVPDSKRITPGWSVGWFFVPFANLFMPFRAMRQTWNGLHGNSTLSAPMPGWTLLWWLAWLVSSAAATAALRISLDAVSLDEFRIATYLDLASSIIAIIAALLFRHLILELTHTSAEASPHVPAPASDPQTSI